MRWSNVRELYILSTHTFISDCNGGSGIDLFAGCAFRKFKQQKNKKTLDSKNF
jgi:hypothetical protein